MIRRPPRSTLSSSSAASDVYKRQTLKNNNLKAFIHDWESMLQMLKTLPTEDLLETLFKKEIRKAEQLKQMLALYDQDTTQKGEPRSYERLLRMVHTHLQAK